LAALFLSVLVFSIQRSIKVQWRNHGLDFVFSGLFLALHWSTYFYSLQVSNVSIAIIALFTYPIITTLIEPLFFRSRLQKVNLFTSALVTVGVIILVPEFSLENNYTLGLVIGLISALFYALRNLVSKRLVTTNRGDSTLVVQLLFAAFFLSPSLLFYNFRIDINTIWLILALSLITTTLGHTLFLLALKRLTTSTASILASLQPVYAIILAVIFIDEKLELNVIIGGVLILMAVIIQNLWPNFKFNLLVK